MDTEELKTIYRDYGYAVHRRCLHILGNRSDADDVLQEVFLRVIRYGHTFDGKHTLGWLYRIADRQCIEAIKLNRRLKPVEDCEKEIGRQRMDVRSSERTILGCEARQIIQAAKKKDAQIAILYYVDEMTQDEVAAEMGCSRKTVKKRLKRFKDLASKMGEVPHKKGGEK